ncbi:MAG: hypothetical protein ACTSR8_22055 [Promethearchaeota archaeon]
MSTAKFFPYKMLRGQWFRADDMTDSDIVVIVDTNTETIWFHEGPKSSARSRSNAREMLGQLKRKYIPYRFERVTNNSPESILEKIEELKEKSFTGKIPGIKLELKDYSRIFYFLNLIGSGLLIISIIFLWMVILSPRIGMDNYLHYEIDYNFFEFYINLNSYNLLAAAITFIISGFFGRLLKKNLFAFLSIIAGIVIFIAFFIMRIWDYLIFFEERGNAIFIRSDALTLFVFNLEILLMTGMIIGFLTAILGLKNIKIFEKVEELELKALTLPPERK